MAYQASNQLKISVGAEYNARNFNNKEDVVLPVYRANATSSTAFHGSGSLLNGFAFNLELQVLKKQEENNYYWAPVALPSFFDIRTDDGCTTSDCEGRLVISPVFTMNHYFVEFKLKFKLKNVNKKGSIGSLSNLSAPIYRLIAIVVDVSTAIKYLPLVAFGVCNKGSYKRTQVKYSEMLKTMSTHMKTCVETISNGRDEEGIFKSQVQSFLNNFTFFTQHTDADPRSPPMISDTMVPTSQVDVDISPDNCSNQSSDDLVDKFPLEFDILEQLILEEGVHVDNSQQMSDNFNDLWFCNFNDLGSMTSIDFSLL